MTECVSVADGEIIPTGEWVPNEDVHPLTNIHARRWMTKDGSMSGVFRGMGSVPPEARAKGILWLFPTQPRERDCEDAVEVKPGGFLSRLVSRFRA